MKQSDSELVIEIQRDTGAQTLTLELKGNSVWSSLLGPWPLPMAGAIDRLDAVLSGEAVRKVVLRGCPSASLLPLLWLRTIWFAGSEVKLELAWDEVESEPLARGRQAAGQLAVVWADVVHCADAQAARQHWGIDPDDPAPAASAFDLLTNLVDLWDTDLHRATQAVGWNDAVRLALISCRDAGARRVALYGGGLHTRSSGDALMQPGVEVVAIIDDDPRRHGQRLWGFPLVSREMAMTMNLDAVVLSANSIEDQLWERSACFRDAGVMVLRLYGG